MYIKKIKNRSLSSKNLGTLPALPMATERMYKMKTLKIMILLACVAALMAVCTQRMNEVKGYENASYRVSNVDIGAVMQATCYR